MAVPKRRLSKSRTRMRRAHDFLKEANNLIQCPNKDCGELMQPHRVCPSCGQYKGKKVISLE